MNAKIAMLLLFVALAAMIATSSAGKHKKVVIHVPYKVKKIKHTHTVYKTIHHHDHGHGHHKRSDEGVEDEHEHFHHFGQHSAVHPRFALPEAKPIVAHGR